MRIVGVVLRTYKCVSGPLAGSRPGVERATGGRRVGVEWASQYKSRFCKKYLTTFIRCFLGSFSFQIQNSFSVAFMFQLWKYPENKFIVEIKNKK